MSAPAPRPLVKLTAPTALGLCKGLEVPDGLRALVESDAPAAVLFARLDDPDLRPFALDLLARALPKREAVWWACLAARLVPAAGPAAKALEAAEAWVFRPNETERRACFPPAEADAFTHPASWAAMGAYWSGGSITPPELQAVPPAAHLTGVAVAAAAKLAIAGLPAAQRAGGMKRLVEQGLDIAAGGNGRVA